MGSLGFDGLTKAIRLVCVVAPFSPPAFNTSNYCIYSVNQQAGSDDRLLGASKVLLPLKGNARNVEQQVSSLFNLTFI